MGIISTSPMVMILLKSMLLPKPCQWGKLFLVRSFLIFSNFFVLYYKILIYISAATLLGVSPGFYQGIKSDVVMMTLLFKYNNNRKGSLVSC